MLLWYDRWWSLRGDWGLIKKGTLSYTWFKNRLCCNYVGVQDLNDYTLLVPIFYIVLVSVTFTSLTRTSIRRWNNLFLTSASLDELRSWSLHRVPRTGCLVFWISRIKLVCPKDPRQTEIKLRLQILDSVFYNTLSVNCYCHIQGLLWNCRRHRSQNWEQRRRYNNIVLCVSCDCYRVDRIGRTLTRRCRLQEFICCLWYLDQIQRTYLAIHLDVRGQEL